MRNLMQNPDETVGTLSESVAKGETSHAQLCEVAELHLLVQLSGHIVQLLTRIRLAMAPAFTLVCV